MPPLSVHAQADLTNLVLSFKGIPSDFLNGFFPSLHLSVSEFLEVSVPAIPFSASATLAWSPLPATVDTSPELVGAVAFPAQAVILQFAGLRPPPNTNSVLVNNLHITLSLAKVLYTWLLVLLRQAEWRAAKEWAQQNLKLARASGGLAARVLDKLDHLCWNDPLHGFSTSPHCSTASLTRFLSTEWLASSDIENLGNVFAAELAERSLPIQVVGPDWISSLQNAKKSCQTTPDAYARSSSFAKLRNLARLLVNQKIDHVAGLANVGGNHWISWIVAGAQKVILIGDSLQSGGAAAISKGVRAPVVEGLCWWLRTAAQLEGVEGDLFDVETLPIQKQTDTVSCGLYAFDSLKAYFNPTHWPLVSQSMHAPRAELFLAIAEHHQCCDLTVSDLES
jgi:hypothetical protein